MKNSTERLGEQVRIERLRCNMTQLQLAENLVSRNMLSMIESGKTLPSLDTVVEIANRLDIPVGLLFASDDESEALYNKISAVSKARVLFSEKRFKECIDAAGAVPFDHELTALIAESYLGIAVSNMEKCMLTSAEHNLDIALEVSHSTMYLSDDFEGTVDAYRFLIECAKDRIDSDKLSKLFHTKSRIEPSLFVYLYVLSEIDKGNYEIPDNISSVFPFLTKHHLKYLKAKACIKDFRFNPALEILHELENKEDIDFITKYRVYADIEHCYENKRDFERAYKYSTLKHHTLECFGN